MSEPRRAEERPRGGWAELETIVRRLWRGARQRASRLLAGERRLELLAAIALAGGTLMILGEFLTLFEVRRGQVAVAEQTGGEQHSYALLLVGAGTLLAALGARLGHWPPAAGVAVLGALALGIALLADLPDATSSGVVAGVRLAEAEPAAGFWVQTVGASIALLSGIAMTYILRFRNNERQPSG